MVLEVYNFPYFYAKGDLRHVGPPPNVSILNNSDVKENIKKFHSSLEMKIVQ